MKRKAEEIPIENLGDAVNHIQAGINFINKQFPKASKAIYSIVMIGFIAGLYYVFTLKRVELKEITPIVLTSNPFMLYAAGDPPEIFVLKSDGGIFVHGKWIGKKDNNYEILKLEGESNIVIVDLKSKKVFKMELDLSNK